MTRRLRSEGLADLLKVTQLKEMAALEEVARWTAALKTHEAQIERLQTRQFSADTPELARQLDKWLSWQQQELRRLNLEAANLRAELIEAAAKFGRAKAEHDVAKRVAQNARINQKRLLEQRKSYIS